MAALIIMAAVHEEEVKKRKILEIEKQKQEESERNILMNSMNPNNGIQYGYMLFTQYSSHGVLMSNYRIYETGRDALIIIENIKYRILNYLERNIKTDFLFYQVENVDPNLVSYNIVRSSNFPHLHIKINKRKLKNICIFYGNKKLKKLVYDKLDFLKDYDSFLEHLETLNKKDLVELYIQIYGQEPKMSFFKKRRMFDMLLDNKKREFIKNY
jgi:hypothetical protein